MFLFTLLPSVCWYFAWDFLVSLRDWDWFVIFLFCHILVRLCPKKGNAEECSNYRTMALVSHSSRVMLKILQARLQQYVNHGLPDVQAGFRKGRGTRDQTANICWIIEKQESYRKTYTSGLLTTPKPWTVWITTNYGKFFKRWKYWTTWPASWEMCVQVRKQQLELDMENRLVPNWERSTSRLYIVTLLI